MLGACFVVAKCHKRPYLITSFYGMHIKNLAIIVVPFLVPILQDIWENNYAKKCSRWFYVPGKEAHFIIVMQTYIIGSANMMSHDQNETKLMFSYVELEWLPLCAYCQ